MWLLLAAGCASASEELDGSFEVQEQAITGAGRFTDSNTAPRYPAVVFLSFAGNCTGTLISPMHVLTARHCSTGVDGQQVLLDTPVSSGTEAAGKRSRRIMTTQLHPDPSTDVAVVLLDRPILNAGPAGAPDYNVRPMTLGSAFESGSTGVSVGFAETLGVDSEGDCINVTGTRRALTFSGGFEVNETEIARNSEACWDRGFVGNDPGDSGGPLLDSSDRVVGVFSGWGGGKAHWARLDAAVRDWIAATVRHHYTNFTDGGGWDWCGGAGATLYRGDFDGDHAVDLLCRVGSEMAVDYADPDGITPGITDWSTETAFCTHAGARLHVADINGDARADLLCKDASSLWIDFSDATGHFDSHDWFSESKFCTHAGATTRLVDVNGDARSDLLCTDTAGRIWVDYADAVGRFGGHDWFREGRFCTHAGSELSVADVNGDGRADLVCHDSSGATWTDFADVEGHYADFDEFVDVDYCTHRGAQIHLGDVNRDGRADLVCHDHRQRLWVDYADGTSRFGGHDWFFGP